MNHELIETNNKKDELLNIINSKKIDKALIFCNKKREIEATVTTLTEQGFKAFSLYNGMEDADKDEVVANFNSEDKVFIACSDSVAKKVKLEGVNFIIGEDLPTRVNDYKTRLSYLGENGIGFTMHNGEDTKKIEDINRFINSKKEKVETIEKANIKAENKTNTENKSVSKKESKTFEGHIPAFLQIDLSNILNKA